MSIRDCHCLALSSKSLQICVWILVRLFLLCLEWLQLLRQDRDWGWIGRGAEEGCCLEISSSVSHRILWDLWRQVTSHINLHIYNVIASSLRTGEFWHFRSVLLYELSYTVITPHRPWDCAVDLLPGAILPKGWVYPLSIPECKAMEDYIKEALQQQFIRPSTSRVASSFFFAGKKDGGLWPCINYQTINDHTFNHTVPYPPPLVPAALEGTLWGPHLLEARLAVHI